MKKILIVAHYSRFLVQFELNDVKLLQGMGYEVHYATNFEHEDMYADAVQVIREHGVILHQVDFVRSPYNILANVKAYKQLKHLMQTEMFAGVHCHTPMAGALARLAANATHTAPVLYTAHGFHFYKGCPLKNRLIYQTAETFLARYTDAQIRAFAKTDMTNSYYLICGEGELKQEHLKLAEELGVSDRVRFLGFRTDVSEILRACDCFVFPSFREGLSVSLMEAMAAGLPCIASRIRGNVDLLPDSRYLFESSDEAALCQLMCDIVDGVQVRQECTRNKKTLEQYDVRNVSEQMKNIYTELLGD